MDPPHLIVSYPFLFISIFSTNVILSIIDLLRYPVIFKLSIQESSMIPQFQAYCEFTKICNYPIFYSEDYYYKILDAPINLKPVKLFSDISGFPACYKDIRTSLNFSDVSEYVSLQNMSIELSHIYHSLRL